MLHKTLMISIEFNLIFLFSFRIPYKYIIINLTTLLEKRYIMEPSYVLQIHTGSFQNAHTDFVQIKNKITSIIERKHIQAVIFGWHLDQSLNQSILDFFHSKNIACYFWLPVLSEIDLIKKSKAITNYTGKQGQSVQVIEDESFSFLCPSDLKNYDNVCDLYQEYISKLNFDGVFLDKIRFPSFANGYEEGFGCFCESCEEIYRKHGIDLNNLKDLFVNHDDSLLDGHYDEYGHYIFNNHNVDLFYKTRSHMMNEFVGNLCDYFHSHDLKVGLDIYAPFFAYHCGQDIYELSKKADFLKPMFYRFTTAPAGMLYEYDAYKQYFKDSSYFNLNPISLDSLKEQCSFLNKAKCDVYPGIEINPIENICSTSKERFIENKGFFTEYFDSLVCCWNCLLMNEEIEECL